MSTVQSSALLVAATLLAIATPRMPLCAESPRVPAADPIQTDPPSRLKPPASMAELKVSTPAGVLNGLVYLPAGAGRHPVVVFLHGYPGNERNLDLAQAVRRAGYAAFFFDYRGDFGTGGTFSRTHGLEDASAALAWVRMPENVEKYRLDPARIALVGHSFGGWLALMSVEHEAPSVCVAAMAAENSGWAAGRYVTHPDEEAEEQAYYRETTDGTGGPVHADPEELMKEKIDHSGTWNYLSQAVAFKDRALLLIAATRDSIDEGADRHQEFASAVRKLGGRHVQVVVFDDDHPFSSHRVALARTLVHWLQTDCAATQASTAR